MNFREVFSTITLVFVTFGLLSPQSAIANDSNELESLRALVQQMNLKMEALEQRVQSAEESTIKKEQGKPIVSSNQDKYNSGFGIQSADGRNKIQFGGLIQLDNRQYFEKNQGDINGFDVRRIRPIIQGTIDGIYDFKFQPEYGDNKAAGSSTNSGIADAYINARFKPWMQLQIGKFAPDVGLERLESSNFNKFIELSTISNNILPNRDIGISLHGNVLNGKVYYAIGVYQGVVDGGDAVTSQSYNGNRDYAVRLFTTPFKGDGSILSGIGIGLAATFGDAYQSSSAPNSSGLPIYRSGGQQSAFFTYGSGVNADGSRTRISPQAYYYIGPFGLIAEYAEVTQDVSNSSRVKKGTLRNDAWQLTGSWFFTGEMTTHNDPVSPLTPFNLDGDGWGAFELVARYQETNIDSRALSDGWAQDTLAIGLLASSAKAWGAGINWYLTKNVKFAANYERTTYEKFVSQLTTRADEQYLLTRIQLAF